MGKALDICAVIAAKGLRPLAVASPRPCAKPTFGGLLSSMTGRRTGPPRPRPRQSLGPVARASTEANSGPLAAGNRAIAEAEAKRVGVLDADDYLTDGRFARILADTGFDWDFLTDDLFLVSKASPDSPAGRLIGVAGRGQRPDRAVSS
jgi:hypothetical protein